MARRRPMVEEPLDLRVLLVPHKNGLAVRAYRCGLYGLIPFAGLVLGGPAILLGMLGLRHALINPDAEGGLHSVLAIVMGTLELLTNGAGCLLILSGLGIVR